MLWSACFFHIDIIRVSKSNENTRRKAVKTKFPGYTRIHYIPIHFAVIQTDDLK